MALDTAAQINPVNFFKGQRKNIIFGPWYVGDVFSLDQIETA